LHKHAVEADHDATVKVQVCAGAADHLAAIEEALSTLARVKGLSVVETGLVGLPAGTGGECGREPPSGARRSEGGVEVGVGGGGRGEAGERRGEWGEESGRGRGRPERRGGEKTSR
jgi:hypothetical protein